VALLRALVGWRLQAEAYGDLDDDTLRRIKAKSLPRHPVLPVGTRLSREYRGIRYDVAYRRWLAKSLEPGGMALGSSAFGREQINDGHPPLRDLHTQEFR
jgi:hypothetical protein